MGGVSEQPLRPEPQITVKLKDLIWASGRIVRTNGRSFGVAFDAPIDLSMLEIAPKSAATFEVSARHIISETARWPRIKA